MHGHLAGSLKPQLVASQESNVARGEDHSVVCVTLILLSTNPWLPGGSRCDPNLKHLVYVPSTPSDHSSDTADEVLLVAQLVIKPRPCTCKPEFPVIASVLAGIEIFIFILFMLNNTLMNAHGKEAPEKRSVASYGSFLGLVAYFTVYMTSLIYMWQSSQYCGIPIFFWTMLSFFFRGLIILFAVGGYEHEVDKKTNGEVSL
jgi:hypothetical protein